MGKSKVISDSCHVLTLAIWTNARDEALLGKYFSTGLAFRNSIVGNAMHRLMRLRQDKIYQELKTTLRNLPTEDKSGRKEIASRLTSIRSSYGLESEYGLEKDATLIKNGFFNTAYLPTHIAQSIMKDVWSGIEKMLFSNGRNLSIKREHEFLSLRGKCNETAIVFDPIAMSVRVGKLVLSVSGSLDDYQETDLAKMRASYLSEKSGNGALPGCIRFNKIVRRLVNDHGRIKWGYWLQVTADGPAPQSNRARKRAETKLPITPARTLAIDPSQTMMSCCTSDGDAFFLLLDGKNPKADAKSREVARRLDESRRASNPERYNTDGTYRKGSVNARTRKKSDWNVTSNYEAVRRRRRLLMQKQGETLRTRRNEMCNNLVSVYPIIKTEGMNYLALSVRSKRMTTGRNGKIRSKKRFGDTIRRFAPSLFLSTLKRKCEAAGGEYVEINPWTLRASQYDPTNDSCTKHKLSQRVFHLSDGTAVQRDLMSALNILCSRREKRKDGKKGKSILADVPDRELLLDSLAWFIPAMKAEMQRMVCRTKTQTVPSAIGTGAWTALLGAGKSNPADAGADVDAPNRTGEDTRAVTRGHRDEDASPDTRGTARNPADTKRKAKPSDRTPRL